MRSAAGMEISVGHAVSTANVTINQYFSAKNRQTFWGWKMDGSNPYYPIFLLKDSCTQEASETSGLIRAQTRHKTGVQLARLRAVPRA